MALCAAVNTAHAGGLMTNTNYHIAFDRMMARGATFDIDAAYSNPAGTVWGHEGWQLSLNFQKPWQNRDIKLTTTALEKTFEGKASAPIVPALFATYKKDRWAISSMIGIVGSGGFVKYADGVPQYNLMVTNALTKLNQLPGVNTDIPLAWKNTYGKGRVFGCSIGHGIDTFRRFDYVGLFVRGCEWAATGSVTLDKPDRSGDNHLKPWPYY